MQKPSYTAAVACDDLQVLIAKRAHDLYGERGYRGGRISNYASSEYQSLGITLARGSIWEELHELEPDQGEVKKSARWHCFPSNSSRLINIDHTGSGLSGHNLALS